MKIKILLLLSLTFIFSCGKEEFAVNQQKDNLQTESRTSHTSSQCTSYTLVRPKVDLLFLWDNSTSTVFINNGVKSSLNNIINSISQKFDYNVMMAPLIGTGNSSSYFFSHSGHSPGSGIQTISKDAASSVIGSFPHAQGSQEWGVERARELLQNNQSNGVFRNGSYVLVVLMSNDNDNSYVRGGSYDHPAYKDLYVKGKTHDLLCIRGNYNGNSGLHNSTYSTYGTSCSGANSLDSPMMRFISITALGNDSMCKASVGLYTPGDVYRNVSNQVYTAGYTNNIAPPTDQGLRAMFPGEGNDAYDICRADYNHIFDGVNNAITDTVVKHTYNYWAIADLNTDIDPATIEVTSSSGEKFLPIDNSVTVVEDSDGKNDVDSNGSPVTGFRYLQGNRYNFNTRFLPTVGEPYSGKFIQLFGNAKITWPNCLTISAKGPKDYYGFVHLTAKPVESSIVLTINGQNIPKSTTSGWELVKSGGEALYIENKNIKVISPTNTGEAIPALLKTGYFIKVNGQAIYSNSASVNVQYDPAGN